MEKKINVDLTARQACHLLETLTQEYENRDSCFSDAPSLEWHIINLQTMLALSEALKIEMWFGLCSEEMLKRSTGKA